MKKYAKILCMLIVSIGVVFLLQTMSFASSDNTLKNLEKSADDAFNFSRFDDITVTEADNMAKTTMATAINVIRTVGTGMALIILSYMGVKYMMASPAEKADFKKSAYIYVVGAVLVFAASNILTLILKFTEETL